MQCDNARKICCGQFQHTPSCKGHNVGGLILFTMQLSLCLHACHVHCIWLCKTLQMLDSCLRLHPDCSGMQRRAAAASNMLVGICSDHAPHPFSLSLPNSERRPTDLVVHIWQSQVLHTFRCRNNSKYHDNKAQNNRMSSTSDLKRCTQPTNQTQPTSQS